MLYNVQNCDVFPKKLVPIQELFIFAITPISAAQCAMCWVGAVMGSITLRVTWLVTPRDTDPRDT